MPLLTLTLGHDDSTLTQPLLSNTVHDSHLSDDDDEEEEEDFVEVTAAGEELFAPQLAQVGATTSLSFFLFSIRHLWVERGCRGR